MAEYIDREAVCYQLEKQESIDGQPRAIRRARRIVSDFPAADVVPVRHGRWIPVKPYNNTYMGFKCSGCGAQFQGVHRDNYCGNCGARMDGDGE